MSVRSVTVVELSTEFRGKLCRVVPERSVEMCAGVTILSSVCRPGRFFLGWEMKMQKNYNPSIYDGLSPIYHVATDGVVAGVHARRHSEWVQRRCGEPTKPSGEVPLWSLASSQARTTTDLATI